MSLIEIFRMVFINVKENKFRVFLTALGIIVGSFTIVMVFGIGMGSMENVNKQYARLNAGTIVIMSDPRARSYEDLSDKDLSDIKDCSSVKSACMVNRSNATLVYNNNSSNASALSVTEDFQQIYSLSLDEGRFITDEDDKQYSKVAVVGSSIVEQFFDNDPSEAIDKEILIQGRRYKIIGVLSRIGSSSGGMNIDESVFLPFEVGRKNVTGRRAMLSIIALADDVKNVQGAIDEISSVIESNHSKYADAFQIRDAGSTLLAAQDAAKTMTILLTSIAAIVLFVGGIGIMNVLFVSVQERTKEIGILKAIGTRKKDILKMFLFESIIISTSGGIIGTLLGIFAPALIKQFNINFVPTLYGNIIALGFSIVTGTFFGYYPAKKAASLKPIDALNYE
ncbi:putative ABC transport system permease protein [Caloramator quimbayensis]|uniref:Putative ABC transport system permease protein n=1 Tax=Caloramator quimbayensis TaxID=1147123 RepID=A0A1T4YCG0_9CLOT|nr:ABC transporter permease [Caloramator quimbayensis]SKA98981.1 putative ABC transport system permease protein [Caloramator quimbayensis]